MPIGEVTMMRGCSFGPLLLLTVLACSCGKTDTYRFPDGESEGFGAVRIA